MLTWHHSSQQAEQVHGWLSRHLPDRPHPAVKRPVNYIAWVVGVVSVLAGAGACFKAWPYVLPVVQSRNAWAALSLIGILMFTSGHMFNQIRKVPYVAGDGKGGISYFTAGFQNQLGMETQIIAAICKSETARSCPARRAQAQVLADTDRRRSFIRHHLSNCQGPEGCRL